MKAMFVGGKLHSQILEVPKGSTSYTTEVGDRNGNFTILYYRALRRPELFELCAYNGLPVNRMPLDFYLNERIVRWVRMISKFPTITKPEQPQ